MAIDRYQDHKCQMWPLFQRWMLRIFRQTITGGYSGWTLQNFYPAYEHGRIKTFQDITLSSVLGFPILLDQGVSDAHSCLSD